MQLTCAKCGITLKVPRQAFVAHYVVDAENEEEEEDTETPPDKEAPKEILFDQIDRPGGSQ